MVNADMASGWTNLGSLSLMELAKKGYVPKSDTPSLSSDISVLDQKAYSAAIKKFKEIFIETYTDLGGIQATLRMGLDTKSDLGEIFKGLKLPKSVVEKKLPIIAHYFDELAIILSAQNKLWKKETEVINEMWTAKQGYIITTPHSITQRQNELNTLLEKIKEESHDQPIALKDKLVVQAYDLLKQFAGLKEALSILLVSQGNDTNEAVTYLEHQSLEKEYSNLKEQLNQLEKSHQEHFLSESLATEKTLFEKKMKAISKINQEVQQSLTAIAKYTKKEDLPPGDDYISAASFVGAKSVIFSKVHDLMKEAAGTTKNVEMSFLDRPEFAIYHRSEFIELSKKIEALYSEKNTHLATLATQTKENDALITNLKSQKDSINKLLNDIQALMKSNKAFDGFFFEFSSTNKT